MALTAGQKSTLKAAILADSAVNTQPNNSDGNFFIAAYYNAVASPDYWVWRSSVSRAEVYNTTSLDATSWDWTIYKGQAVAEQNAWTQMFMGDEADFSKTNLRAGIGKIFGASNANTLHCLAIARRKATRAEKLFAVDTVGSGTGRGLATDPDTMTFEGQLTGDDAESARQS